VDAAGHVTDDSVRKFLKAFVDRFTDFAGRFAPRPATAAAA
jgi:hypothetical protein